MKPDAVDMKILGALMEDGRASFREVARKTSLTTPTVSARMARMSRAGLIRRFVPVLSSDSIDRGVLVLVVLKVGPYSQDGFAREISRLREVVEVYLTADQGVALKVALDDVRDLQPFLRRLTAGKPRAAVTLSQIVTSVVKEEPPTRLPKVMELKLKCDYCHGDVTTGRPYSLVAGASRYYFCCKTCRRGYLDKYGPRLAKLRGATPRKTSLLL